MLEVSQGCDFFFLQPPDVGGISQSMKHWLPRQNEGWCVFVYVCVCAVRVEGTHTPALLLLSFQQEQETTEGTRIATNSFLIQ